MSEPNTFEIKDYRQPLVTSLGVILGFLLGFLGQWVTEPDFALRNASDHLTFWGSLVAAAMLLRALYRMLQPVHASADVLAHYRQTLRLYMAGIALAFVTILCAEFLM